MSDTNFPQITQKISKHISTRWTYDSFNCFVLNRTPQLLLVESYESDYSRVSRLYTADARSSDVSLESVLDLLHKISSLSISPDDRYIGILDDPNRPRFYLYELSAMGPLAALRISYTDRFGISRFVFVDSPAGAKLVFVDAQNRLGVIGLEVCALEFLMAHSARVKAVFYVDQSSVLVYTKNAEFGLFCLASLSITGLVRLTPEQRNSSSDSSHDGGSVDTAL